MEVVMEEKDNVVQFPGLTYGKISPVTIAENLKEVAEGLESIIICGFDKEGKFYYATSEGENKENLWIAHNLQMSVNEHIMGGNED